MNSSIVMFTQSSSDNLMVLQIASVLTGSRNNQKIRFGVPEGEEGGGVITVRCGRWDVFRKLGARRDA